METLPIDPELLQSARARVKEFDAQKIYNKIKCGNNWIGFLGEIMFKQWLEFNGIGHEWKEFVKRNWDEPDFVINGKTVDVKTTFDTKMWFQKPKFDYYVFCRINHDFKNFFIIGWITKQRLERYIKESKLQEVKRENRKDYILPISRLSMIEKFKKEVENGKG